MNSIIKNLLAIMTIATPTAVWARDAAPEAVNPPDASIPGISQAMIVPADGRIVYLSGHVPFGANGVAKGDFDAQLEQVFTNMAATLAAAGGDFSSVARVTFFVKDYDGSQLEALRKVRDRWVDVANPPASALIGVQALFHPDVLVEVDAVAVLPAADD